jgi:hypothetical protein
MPLEFRSYAKDFDAGHIKGCFDRTHQDLEVLAKGFAFGFLGCSTLTAMSW